MRPAAHLARGPSCSSPRPSPRRLHPAAACRWFVWIAFARVCASALCAIAQQRFIATSDGLCLRFPLRPRPGPLSHHARPDVGTRALRRRVPSPDAAPGEWQANYRRRQHVHVARTARSCNGYSCTVPPGTPHAAHGAVHAAAKKAAAPTSAPAATKAAEPLPSEGSTTAGCHPPTGRRPHRRRQASARRLARGALLLRGRCRQPRRPPWAPGGGAARTPARRPPTMPRSRWEIPS